MRGLASAETKSRSFLGNIDGRLQAVHKSSAWGAIMQGVGLGAGLSAYNLVSSAIGQVVSTVEGSLKSASDLYESQNKIRVVFGDSADSVLKLGR